MRGRVLALNLERDGHEVSECSGVREARKSLQTEDFDVILTDQKMPDGDGLQVLAAAIEAEYRLQRADLLVALQWWLRDVWVRTLSIGGELLNFPQLAIPALVAKRISSNQAMENLRVLERTQRLLGSNVQEALALEVGLLKLNL